MAKLPKITGVDDGSSKQWRELAPKPLNEEFIPEGTITFREFRNQLGKAMFPDAWTGEECAGWLAGSFGSVHRSEAERDADILRRQAQAVMQYECAGLPVPPSLRSDDAGENSDGNIDDEQGVIHTFVPLTPEQIEAIDRDLKPVYEKALAVKGRRVKVEPELKQIFGSGLLGAFYISLSGQEKEIPPNSWRVKRERGTYLLDETHLHEAGFFQAEFSGKRRRNTILIDADKARTVLSAYEAGESGPNEVLGATDESAITHSGLKGRPSPRRAYVVEFARRVELGEIETASLIKQARVLHQWFEATYPELNSSTPKVVADYIREAYWVAKREKT